MLACPQSAQGDHSLWLGWGIYEFGQGAFPLTSCDVRSLIALALFRVMGPVAVLLLVDPPTLLVAFLGI